MDFAEYIRKSDVSENTKVCYDRFLWNGFHEKNCYISTLEFQIEGEGGINWEAGKFQPK